MTEIQAKHLGESLKKFGYVEPIAVNLDGKIIGGHMRRRVLMMQALVEPGAEVDVRVPSRLLEPDEATELALRLNRNTGEWDFDVLANEFDEDLLRAWGFDDKDFGIMHDEPLPPPTQHEVPSGGDQKCPKCGYTW